MGDSWKVLKARFGDKCPKDITKQDCLAHIEERRERGISDGTLNTELGHLKMVCNWAVKAGLIPWSPNIEKPKKPAPKVAPLERSEVRRLIDAAEHEYLRMFIILAVATAGRKTAVLQLTWDRVDWSTNQINLDNPDLANPHKNRPWVPLNDMALAALKAVPEDQRHGRIININGRGIDDIIRGVYGAAKRAGIRHVHPHMLRHTAAVHMLQAGMPLNEVSQYLGHKSIEITNRFYGRFQKAYLAKAASHLNY
jgi:integrase